MQLESLIAGLTERLERIERLLAAGAAKPRYTVPEVAQELGCSERQVWRLISLRTLASKKIAGKTMVERAEIDRYIAEAV